jgi:oligopeptide/dipeptide ABC transporter ATP-binding protein
VPARASRPLIEVSGLVKHYPRRVGGLIGARQHLVVRAVDDVSFEIYPGETLALVGESGSGKSTIGETLLLLQQPTAGDIRVDGVSILGLSRSRLQRLRQHLQIVFQNPYSSLDPRMKVREIVAEPLQTHGISRDAAQQRVAELLRTVRLEPSLAHRFPHEMSGGQRQRVSIARALGLNPKFVVLDEPTSALDVSVQAQIVNLLMDLQRDFHLTYLFISHDLRIVRHISDRVAVMYLGKIVEIGPKRVIFGAPGHPYTKALLSAVPGRDRTTPGIILEGEIPSPMAIPSGCRFHTRCPVAIPLCREIEPKLRPMGPAHLAACHLAGETPDFVHSSIPPNIVRVDAKGGATRRSA